MNQPEIKFETSGVGGVTSSETKGELESLRTLVAVSLVLVIVFIAGVDFYLSRQASDLGRMVAQGQLAEQNTAKKLAANSSRAAEFWTKLVEYSKTHADFVPVIDKWKSHIVINTTTNGHPAK